MFYHFALSVKLKTYSKIGIIKNVTKLICCFRLNNLELSKLNCCVCSYHCVCMFWLRKRCSSMVGWFAVISKTLYPLYRFHFLENIKTFLLPLLRPTKQFLFLSKQSQRRLFRAGNLIQPSWIDVILLQNISFHKPFGNNNLSFWRVRYESFLCRLQFGKCVFVLKIKELRKVEYLLIGCWREQIFGN